MATPVFNSPGKGRMSKEAGWLAASVAAGLVAGAGLMYLLDPASGRSRRARLREKSMKLAHRTSTRAGKLSRHLWNKGQGLAAQLRKRAVGEAQKLSIPSPAGKPELPEKAEAISTMKEKRAG